MTSSRTDLAKSEMCSWAVGPRYTLTAELRRQERRGDIRVFWEGRSEVGWRTGRIQVPYVRLRSVRAAQRRAALTLAGWTVGGIGALSGLLVALYEARVVIMYAVGGAVLLVLGVLTLLRLLAHEPGCVGMHCPGCKSH